MRSSRLRQLPDAPERLVRLPGPEARDEVIGRPSVPGSAVVLDVLAAARHLLGLGDPRSGLLGDLVLDGGQYTLSGHPGHLRSPSAYPPLGVRETPRPRKNPRFWGKSGLFGASRAAEPKRLQDVLAGHDAGRNRRRAVRADLPDRLERRSALGACLLEPGRADRADEVRRVDGAACRRGSGGRAPRAAPRSRESRARARARPRGTRAAGTACRSAARGTAGSRRAASPSRRATDPRCAAARPCRPSRRSPPRRRARGTARGSGRRPRCSSRRGCRLRRGAQDDPRSRGGACRGYTRPQTRSRRSPAGRTAAKPSTRQPLSSRRVLCVDRGEIREQVERAGHEHRLAEACARARAPRGGRPAPRRRRTSGRRAPRAHGTRERSRVRRPRGDEPPAEGREPAEHPIDVLVGEDRRHHRVVVRGEMLDEPPDTGRVVGAVPDLTGPPLEPAGKRDARERALVELLGPEECPRRGEREAARAIPPRRPRGRRPRRARRPPTPARRARRCSPGRTTASFSAAIASRVSPSTSRVLERDVREHDDARRVEHVGRVVAGPRGPPRRPRPRRAPSRKATNAAAVSTSNWVAARSSAAGRTVASAGSRSASAPATRMRSAQERT